MRCLFSLLFVLFAAILPACEPANTLRVHFAEGDDTAENRELVREAAAWWGLDVQFVDRDYGALRVDIREHGDIREDGAKRNGVGTYNVLCDKRRMWAIAEVKTVAHEMAHAVANEGHEESDIYNLMNGHRRVNEHGEDIREDLTDAQIDRVQEKVEAFTTWCPQ